MDAKVTFSASGARWVVNKALKKIEQAAQFHGLTFSSMEERGAFLTKVMKCQAEGDVLEVQKFKQWLQENHRQ